MDFRPHTSPGSGTVINVLLRAPSLAPGNGQTPTTFTMTLSSKALAHLLVTEGD